MSSDRRPFAVGAWIWVRTRKGLRPAHVVTDDGANVTFRFTAGGLTFSRSWLQTFARNQRVSTDN